MALTRRPTRRELDHAIIDRAALLFARHGYAHTSVQEIADAVGYSKTGLLHRFGSKEVLRQAAADTVATELADLVAATREVPAGPRHDLAVIEAIVELALRRHGAMALMVSALTAHESLDDLAWLHGVAEVLSAAFDVELRDAGWQDAGPGDVERRVRVLGAMGAVEVVVLAASAQGTPPPRDLLVAAAYGALGHPAEQGHPGAQAGTRSTNTPQPR